MNQKSKRVTANTYPARFMRGFTLIEVIVSMAIIAIAFSITLLGVNTLNVSRNQRYENIAYHAAQKKMEQLRNTTVASLPSSGAISDALLSSIPSGSGSFTVTDYSGYNGLKEMVVTVTWNNGSAKSVVLRTLVGGSGLNPQ